MERMKGRERDREKCYSIVAGAQATLRNNAELMWMISEARNRLFRLLWRGMGPCSPHSECFWDLWHKRINFKRSADGVTVLHWRAPVARNCVNVLLDSSHFAYPKITNKSNEFRASLVGSHHNWHDRNSNITTACLCACVGDCRYARMEASEWAKVIESHAINESINWYR